MRTDEEKEAVRKMVKDHLSTIKEEEAKPRPTASYKHWNRMSPDARAAKILRLIKLIENKS